MIEFITWLFLTLVLFLIVFIFSKILETANRMHRQTEIENRLMFLQQKTKEISEMIYDLKTKKKIRR